MPPIPTTTPEGIRVQAIADTIRALNAPTPDHNCGLDMQPGDFAIYAERLGVPAMFLAAVYHERCDVPDRAEHIEEYVAWRQRLARKAVA